MLLLTTEIKVGTQRAAWKDNVARNVPTLTTKEENSVELRALCGEKRCTPRPYTQKHNL